VLFFSHYFFDLSLMIAGSHLISPEIEFISDSSASIGKINKKTAKEKAQVLNVSLVPSNSHQNLLLTQCQLSPHFHQYRQFSAIIQPHSLTFLNETAFYGDPMVINIQLMH
jgi:hypothetical protein